jgi:hypothetical protein
MVSPIRLYSFKIKGFGFQQNKYALLLLAIGLLMIILLGYTGIFLLIPVYILYAGILAVTLNN